MSLDIEKLQKIASLMTSDNDGEALAALRKTASTLDKAGLSLADVFIAGTRQLTAASGQVPPRPRNSSPFDSTADDIFDAFFRGAQQAYDQRTYEDRRAAHEKALRADAAARKEREQAPRTIYRDVEDIPVEQFQAYLRIQSESHTQGGDDMLHVTVTRELGSTIERFPSMVMFGKTARRLKEATQGADMATVFASLSVRKPAKTGQSPVISSLWV